MSRYRLSLFSLVFLFSCTVEPDAARRVPKEYRSTPPGTVWLRDSIYIDQSEVRNVDYLEFVHWTRQFDPLNLKNVLPDTTVWLNREYHDAMRAQLYFRSPVYRRQPVVGVSFQQVLMYCKWRTDQVNQFRKLFSESHPYSVNKVKLYYRLPSEEEWELAASAGGDKEHGFVSLLDKRNVPKVLVSETVELGYYDLSMLLSATGKKQNAYGVSECIGNVAEMIAIPGVAKGGSFLHTLSQSNIHSCISYDAPACWLGFRCVCVVERLKK